jgi:hypothetical protein
VKAEGIAGDVTQAGDDIEDPSGIPACEASSASRRVVRVASSGGLITTELPVASVGPIFQASMAIGKFHGSNATTHESLIDDEADSAPASAAIHDVVTPVRTSQPLASR